MIVQSEEDNKSSSDTKINEVIQYPYWMVLIIYFQVPGPYVGMGGSLTVTVA